MYSMAASSWRLTIKLNSVALEVTQYFWRTKVTILALLSIPSSFSSLDISRRTSHSVGLSVRLPTCCKVGAFKTASDILGLQTVAIKPRIWRSLRWHMTSQKALRRSRIVITDLRFAHRGHTSSMSSGHMVDWRRRDALTEVDWVTSSWLHGRQRTVWDASGILRPGSGQVNRWWSESPTSTTETFS